jgi:hypothetical protein
MLIEFRCLSRIQLHNYELGRTIQWRFQSRTSVIYVGTVDRYLTVEDLESRCHQQETEIIGMLG